eukprot:jgi/Psemu1/189006/e_gw1.83.99.1
MNILWTSCLVLGVLFLPIAADAFTSPDIGFRKSRDVACFPTSTATSLHAIVPNRRHFGGLLGSGILSWGAASLKDAEAAAVTQTGPLVDVPMVRLRLPKGGFGREYIALKLKVQGQGPFDFMIDSGLTTELITPHLRGILGISEGRSRLSGLAAGGRTVSNAVVELTGASIDAGGGSPPLDLPKLTAVITSFPQEHIDPSHDPVEGMLGMELLSLFDVDLDFPNNRIRLFEPGTADTSGLVEIPAVVINESMLIGIRVSTTQENSQPILGFLDCGSTFSCINWKAAHALGLPPKDDPSYRSGPAVAALGIDGTPLTLPTVKKQLSYAGNPIVDPKTGRPVAFESPPTDWKPWNTVQLAVGDIPVFSNILGDGVTPYEGPAALIGLDILAQRRVVLEAGTTNSRRRKVAIAPK